MSTTNTTPTSNAAAIAARLNGTKRGNGWRAVCPAHDDNNPSLSIMEGQDGRTLLHCFAGCTVEAVVKAAGLTMSDLAPARSSAPRRIVQEYDYVDAGGNLVFQVVRFEPKDFRQRRPDPKNPGSWIWNLQGVERVLYRLPAVLNANADGATVFCTEGEKDADALVAIGLCATCNAGGAGKWHAGYTSALTGADVTIIADKDAPGRSHAAMVLEALTGKATSVRVLELPDRDGHPVKDAADWIAAGGTATELQALVETAPEWTPPDDTSCLPESTQARDVKDIRAKLWKIAQTPKLSATERNRASADAVVAWLHARGHFYFHAQRRDFASIMYFDSQLKLLQPVQSDAFTAWLSDTLAVNHSETIFKFVAAAVETEGLSQRATGIDPAAFWAATPTAIYMSNGPGSMVRIKANVVEVVDNGTDGILFPYGSTLNEWKLTEPIDPFESCSLFRDASTLAVHGKDLFRVWVLSLPTDQRTKAPLVLSGVVGSGKTRQAYGIFELYGLTPRISKVTKNGEGDFWTSMEAGGLSCFDNVDTKIEWLPDALAAASTAGSLEKRRLYSDFDRVVLRPKSWVCVTSASPTFAADAGLADRLLVVRLGRRQGDTEEATLADEIATYRDAGLSWIAHTLSRALADKDDVPGKLNARHPDFARLAVRIGRAMGRGDQVIAALSAAEDDKSTFNLENDVVGTALLELLQDESFDGTASDLFGQLITIDPKFNTYNWSPKRLAKQLKGLMPHLESVFKVTTERDGHSKQLVYHFKPVESAGIAGIQVPFSDKSHERDNIRTLPENTLSIPAIPAKAKAGEP